MLATMNGIRATAAGAIVTVVLAALAGGCAHITEMPPEAGFGDDLGAEAGRRCLERRGSLALVPSKEFRTDGCTMWPDGNWQACCVAHDMDYWCGGTAAERDRSDKQLRDCVADAGHPGLGKLMNAAIHVTGSPAWPFPWRWGYGWKWLGPMQRPEAAE